MVMLRSLSGVAGIYLVVLALLPFHALFTTWLGSNFGHIDLWRTWKELAILATVPVVGYLALTDQETRVWLRRAWLPRLVLAYMVLHLILGIAALGAGRVNTEALSYGLLVNLRFIGFMLLTMIVARQTPVLLRHWPKAVFVPLALVLLFGILQLTVLPYDFFASRRVWTRYDSCLSDRRQQAGLSANPIHASWC